MAAPEQLPQKEPEAAASDDEIVAAAANPQACVMPDGSVVMLSKENPYREALEGSQTASAADGEEFADPSPRVISAAVLHAPLQLERMARVVRLLALFDLAFALLHTVADTWPAFMAAIMSYCGYLGARLFRRDLTRVYLIYLVLFCFARAALALHFVISPPSNADAAKSLPTYLALTAMVQAVIAHFVYRFMRLLPTSAEGARFVQALVEAQYVMRVNAAV